jgi:hypothetical protein
MTEHPKFKVEVRKEHAWLARLVGEWSYESAGVLNEGEPPERSTGTESVRSLDGVWIVCEGRGGTPGGGTSRSIMTLGYDVARRRCVGSFVGTTLTHLWVYDGEVDPSGEVLTLTTEGPGFSGEGALTRYRDVFEFRGDDARVQTSYYLDDASGEWREMFTSTYQRVK